MKRLSELCNIKYTEDLLRPTIGNKNWLGNSHYGPTKGISNKISANYPKVLTKNEISTIKLFSDNIDMHLTENKTPVDLLSIPQKYLYEYKRQKKYFNETEKLILYMLYLMLQKDVTILSKYLIILFLQLFILFLYV